jgi:methionyl-tRNA formyltransferase
LRVVVLTCSEIGIESAAALATVPSVHVVGVVVAPQPRPRSVVKRLRTIHRRQGPLAVLTLPIRRVRALLRRMGRTRDARAADAPVPVIHVDRFESPSGLAALRDLAPDLAVVDGTYVLRPATFELPRFGSVNLHCGRLPEYRGAPPGFWEMRNGETEVGVTIHRVTARLDEGPILASATVPLDPAPPGDPMQYLHALWREALRPEGIRLMCEVTAAIARGEARAVPQPQIEAETYRFPDWATVRKLREQVRARRAERRVERG